MITAKSLINEIYQAESDVFSLLIYMDGKPATVSSASFECFRSSGNTVVSGTASVSASKITVDIPGGAFPDKEPDCRMDVEAVIDGKTERIRKYFNIVESKILNTVVTEDLTDLYPDLKDELPEGVENFSVQIEEAYQKVKTDIYDRGDRIRLVVDDEQIHPLIRQKALEIICNFSSRTTDDIWWERHLKHKKEYESALQKTKFKYDMNEDGNVDGESSIKNHRCVR